MLPATSQKGKCYKFNHHRTPLRHHDLTSCVACQRFHSRPLIAMEKSTKMLENTCWDWLPTILKKTPGITPVKLSIRYQKRWALEHVTPFKHGNLLVSMLNLGRVQVPRLGHPGVACSRDDPTDPLVIDVFFPENTQTRVKKKETLINWTKPTHSTYCQLIEWFILPTFGQFIYNYPLNYPDLPSLEGKVDPFRQKSLDIAMLLKHKLSWFEVASDFWSLKSTKSYGHNGWFFWTPDT